MAAPCIEPDSLVWCLERGALRRHVQPRLRRKPMLSVVRAVRRNPPLLRTLIDRTGTDMECPLQTTKYNTRARAHIYTHRASERATDRPTTEWTDGRTKGQRKGDAGPDERRKASVNTQGKYTHSPPLQTAFLPHLPTPLRPQRCPTQQTGRGQQKQRLSSRDEQPGPSPSVPLMRGGLVRPVADAEWQRAPLPIVVCGRERTRQIHSAAPSSNTA